MLTRLGHFTVRRRRLVLSFTVLFMLVGAVIGTRAFGVLEGGGFEDPSSESARAGDALDREFGTGEYDLVLVATAAAGDVDSPGAVAAGEALAAKVAAVPGVQEVASYWSLERPPTLRSDSGDRAMVLVRVDDSDEAAEDIVAGVRDAVEGDQGGLTVGVGGGEAVSADVTSTIEGDLGRAEAIATPITLVLLLLVFGGLIAASLPLFVGVLAVLGTFLSLYVIGSLTDVSVYAINLTTALGLGLAIDYSLFIVSRYREELRHGASVEDAVVRAVETAGRTIAISALTVAVSLSALLVFPQYFLRSFAYAGIAVVLLAMVGAIVALPALLAIVGHRIDSLRVLRRHRPRIEEDGFWYRTATRVMRHPVPVAIGVVAVLLLLGSPFLRVQFGTPDDRVLPESAPSREVSAILRTDFEGDASESFPVVVPASPATSTAPSPTWPAGCRLSPGWPASRPAPGRSPAARSTRRPSPTTPATPDRTPAGCRWCRRSPWRRVSGERLVRDIRGLDTDDGDVLVGGPAAELVDTKASIVERLPLAIGLIVVATFVLLFLLAGSVLVPIKALVLNVLSLTATFGAMVWIFQDGHLGGWLGFTATGAVDTSMPILMFCIAFGLSMDYEVFLLSRIKEEHDRTGDNDHAVALGLERTGRIVTAAALLLSVTFFAFGTSGVSFIKMFGIGLGIAVLIDAFVIRGTLVPAFMKLAGEANWWAPAPLRRLHDRFGVQDASGVTQPAEVRADLPQNGADRPEPVAPARGGPHHPPRWMISAGRRRGRRADAPAGAASSSSGQPRAIAPSSFEVLGHPERPAQGGLAVEDAEEQRAEPGVLGAEQQRHHRHRRVDRPVRRRPRLGAGSESPAIGSGAGLVGLARSGPRRRRDRPAARRSPGRRAGAASRTRHGARPGACCPRTAPSRRLPARSGASPGSCRRSAPATPGRRGARSVRRGTGSGRKARVIRRRRTTSANVDARSGAGAQLDEILGHRPAVHHERAARPPGRTRTARRARRPPTPAWRARGRGTPSGPSTCTRTSSRRSSPRRRSAWRGDAPTPAPRRRRGCRGAA